MKQKKTRNRQAMAGKEEEMRETIHVQSVQGKQLMKVNKIKKVNKTRCITKNIRNQEQC